jgi:hypothetical protein
LLVPIDQTNNGLFLRMLGTAEEAFEDERRHLSRGLAGLRGNVLAGCLPREGQISSSSTSDTRSGSVIGMHKQRMAAVMYEGLLVP